MPKPTPPPDTHGLMPREHGAYFMLAMPLASALMGAGPSGGGLAWSAFAAIAFVAHEPLLVLAGRRGARRNRDPRPSPVDA
jgi:hypothetical protein